MATQAFRMPYQHAKCPSPNIRPEPPRWLRPGRDVGKAYTPLRISYDYWTKVFWATPPWLTGSMIDDMRAIYEERKDGEHVDHIVPLKSPIVCGLHVPWNLQVLPAGVNLSKSNHYWPGHPLEQLELF